MLSLRHGATGLVGAWRAAAAKSAALAASQQLQRSVGTSASTSAGSHSDFEPTVKEAAPASGDVIAIFNKDITSHKVFVYMKGVPQAPRCGFSNMVCQILDAYGVQYGSRNVLEDDDVREGIKTFSNWPTIPQVYVGGEFVGGSDIVHTMHKSGELEALLGPIAKAQRAAATAPPAP